MVRAIPLGLVDEIRPVGGHVVFGLAVLRGDDPLPDQLLPWEAENHVVASPVEQGQHLLNRGVLRGDDLVGLWQTHLDHRLLDYPLDVTDFSHVTSP